MSCLFKCLNCGVQGIWWISKKGAVGRVEAKCVVCDKKTHKNPVWAGGALKENKKFHVYKDKDKILATDGELGKIGPYAIAKHLNRVADLEITH